MSTIETVILIYHRHKPIDQDGSVGITAEVRFPVGANGFLYSQPPIKCDLRAVLSGVNCKYMKLTTHLHLVPSSTAPYEFIACSFVNLEQGHVCFLHILPNIFKVIREWLTRSEVVACMTNTSSHTWDTDSLKNFLLLWNPKFHYH
jgi:hypothetical protein